LPDYIFFKDAESRFVINNRSHIRVLGATTQQELVGKRDFDIFPPELASQYYADEQEIIRSGQALINRIESTIDPQGNRQWLLTTKAPLRDSQGQLMGLVGISRDIIGYRQAEIELARRGIQVALINDIGSQIAAVLELDKLLNRATRLMQETFDYHHVALFLVEGEALRLKAVSGSYELYFPPGHSQLLDEGINGRVAASGKKIVANDVRAEPNYISLIAEHTITKSELCLPIRVAGQTVGVLDIQSPYLNAFGENEVIVMETLTNQIAVAIENAGLYEAVQQELTERRRTEKALQRKTTEFEAIFKAIPDTVIFTDTKRQVIMCNPAITTMFGYNPAEVLGKHTKLLYASQDDYEEQGRIRFNLSAEEKLKPYEVTCRRKKGEVFVSETVGIAVKDADGNTLGFLGILRDITERKQAEEQIKASLKEKEVLLKEIHHRVKNNLQIISSLLSLQAKHIRDEQALEVFKESRNRVRSMALIHEKLYQSKDLARIDFAEYIQKLAVHLCHSYRISSKAIRLKTNVANVLLGIDTAIPCGLIINELVSNSLKHAFPPETGREGEIYVDLKADNKNQLALIVGDNGAGFPQDVDFRNVTTLGLRLVNTLTKQLRGTIELNREGGTTFKIVFRVKDWLKLA
jgi:PAS domain S-box-containing protein